MTKYFYTLDSDFYINENADISYVEADSYEEAEKLILKKFNDSIEVSDNQSIEVIEGQFSDCWVKGFYSRYVALAKLSGISGVPCRVQSPGTHPGGNFHWITPSVPVYIANILTWEE